MKAKILGLMAVGFLTGPFVAHGVVLGNQEWRQLTETTGFSWQQVNTICGSGVCSGGQGALATFNGWKWANNSEIQALFEQLILPNSIQFPTAFSNYTVGSLSELAAFEAAFSPTLVTGFTTVYSGFSRDLFSSVCATGQSAWNPRVLIPAPVGVAQLGATDSCTQASDFAGFWLYRTLTPEEQLTNLIELVVGLNVNAGIGNALDSKLQNAVDALDRAQNGDTASAVGILYAFINSVEAQRGKRLNDEQANELVKAAQDIIDALS